MAERKNMDFDRPGGYAMPRGATQVQRSVAKAMTEAEIRLLGDAAPPHEPAPLRLSLRFTAAILGRLLHASCVPGHERARPVPGAGNDRGPVMHIGSRSDRRDWYTFRRPAGDDAVYTASTMKEQPHGRTHSAQAFVITPYVVGPDGRVGSADPVVLPRG